MTIAALTKADFKPLPAVKAAERILVKAALTSDSFDRLSDQARQRAFRIARVNNAKLIQRARDIIARSIREGTSWPDTRIKLLDAFSAKKVDAPALSRLQFVFRQNAAQAYNDARRDVLTDPDIAEAFPFWQYLTVGNGTPGVNNVRADHARLHGLIFRADDSFWKDHYPPWDWGCRCYVVALTPGQVKRMGVTVRNKTYVRRKLRVQPNAPFMRSDGDLAGIERELREALEEMLK